MSRLIAAVIRHADYQQLANTPSAWQPFPLTRLGMQQAMDAAIGMRSFVQQNEWQLIEEIDTSSLLRAWQTAHIYMTQLQKLFPSSPQLHSYDALAERSVGSAANFDLQQIEKIVAQDPRFDSLPENWKSDSRFKLPLPGAESLLEAGERVAEHMRRQMSELPRAAGVHVKLFVGHGAAFRHAAYHLGIIGFEQIAGLSMHHARPVYLEFMADGSWRHIAGDWKRRVRNDDYTD